MASKATCPGCAHDADLDAVLRSRYSEFEDHIESCPVARRHAAKLAEDKRWKEDRPGRPRPGEKAFFCPDPNTATWVDHRGKIVDGRL